jgi:hypothetical protein
MFNFNLAGVKRQLHFAAGKMHPSRCDDLSGTLPIAAPATSPANRLSDQAESRKEFMALSKEALAKLFVSVILNEVNDLNHMKTRDSSLHSE